MNFLKKAQGLVELVLVLAIASLVAVLALQTETDSKQIVQNTGVELRDNFEYTPTAPTDPKPGALQPPIARFAINATNDTGDFFRTSLTLTALDQSTDPDGRIEVWQWAVDGTPVSCDSNSSNMTHDYSITDRKSLSQTYTITLKVIDNDGLENSTSQVITITRPAPPPFKISISGTTTLDQGESGNYTMSVVDWGASRDTQQLSSVTWDDTNQTNKVTYTRTFDTAGNIVVKVTAVNDWGQEDTVSMTVVVKEANWDFIPSFWGIEKRVQYKVFGESITYYAKDATKDTLNPGDVPSKKIDERTWVVSRGFLWINPLSGANTTLPTVTAVDPYYYRIVITDNNAAGGFILRLDVKDNETVKTANCSEQFFVLNSFPSSYTDVNGETSWRYNWSYRPSVDSDNKSTPSDSGSPIPYFQPSYVRQKLFDGIKFSDSAYNPPA